MLIYQEDSKLAWLLVVVGSFVLLRSIWRNATWLLRCIDVFFFSEIVDLKFYGQWAVVTGATNGIGKAFSEQLAQKGMSIVLVSRSMEKLETFGRELIERYNVDVKVIVADFSRSDIYQHISSELEGLEIGVLVNNVGIAYPFAQYFLEVEPEIIDTMVQVNTLSLVKMTHIILPKMLDRTKGVIINVGSSAAALSPYPFLAEYCATKHFFKIFTECLQYEYKDQHSIVIQHLAPSYVSTNMIRKRPNFIIQSATSYVRSALKTVLKCSSTDGCIQHEFLSFFFMIIPHFLRIRLITKFLSSARLKALKREARKSKL